MGIAGDQEMGAGRARKGDEVIILWVERETRSSFWIGNHRGQVSKTTYIFHCFVLREVPSELGSEQNASQLPKQCFRYHHLDEAPEAG